jgi:predicted transcriptional regulator
MMATKNRKKPPTTVHLQLSPDVMERVDALAEAQSRTRINMVQFLIKQALTMQQAMTPSRHAGTKEETARA